MKKRLVAGLLILVMLLTSIGGFADSGRSRVTISIDRKTVDQAYILEPVELELRPGESAWDLTKRVLEDWDIEADYDYNEDYNTVYIKSIDGLGEFDHGMKSGWMYNVNGIYPEYGAANYSLEAGDKLEWRYTKDLGEDLGHSFEEVDKSGLRTSLDSLEKVLSEAEYKEPGLRAAKSAYENGETVYQDPASSTEDVSAAIARIDQALEALEKIDAEEVDKGKLEKLIRRLEELLASDKYSDLDLARLARLYDKAQELYGNDQASQEDLGELEGQIKEVINSLEELESGDLDLDRLLDINLEYIYGAGSPQVGSIGGEWSVIALARSNFKLPASYIEEYYNRARKYINKNIEDGRLSRSKSTDNSRLILSLTSIAKDVSNVDGHNLLEGLRDMDYIEKQGLNGPVWALIALDSHDYDIVRARPGERQTTREALIATILDRQLEDGGWALATRAEKSEPDMTAMVIQALAKYRSKPEVKRALNQALETLSRLQNKDAGYGVKGFSSTRETPNLESTAQVLLALNYLDIDPLKDPRFIKGGQTILDDLARYAFETGGFKHSREQASPDGMASEQGSYALVSYDRYLSGKDKLYDMTDLEIEKTLDDYYYIDSNIRDEKVSSKDYSFWARAYKNNKEIDLIVEHNNRRIRPRRDSYNLELEEARNLVSLYIMDQGKLAYEVKFRLDLEEEDLLVEEEKVKLSIDKKTIGGGFIIRPREVELRKNDSVWDITRRLLDREGIKYNYSYTAKYNSVYIESIDGLGEFDHGPDSGWMYNVNGKYPSYGASQYRPRKNDRIEWRYTKDLGADLGQDLEEWEEELDSKYLKDLRDLKDRAEKILRNKKDYSKKNIEALEQALDMKEKTLAQLKKKIKALEEALEALEAERTVDSLEKELGELKKIIGDLDRSLYKKEDLARLDKALKLPEASSEEIREKISHLKEALGKLNPKLLEEVLFKDWDQVAAWALDDINEALRLGIVKGDGDSFRPKDRVSRSEFIKILLLALDKDLGGEVDNNFIDVYKDDWYYAYVNRGYELGLIRGHNYSYRPRDYISREEIASIAGRSLGLESPSLEKPLDYGEVSGWARQDVLKAMEKGLMLGDAGYFRPKDYTTREMAVVIAMRLRNLYKI